MNILSTIFVFVAYVGIIGLMGWMVIDAFMVIKYGLVDDDIYNEDED